MKKLARLYRVDISLFFCSDINMDLSDESLNHRPKKIGNGKLDNTANLEPKEKALIAFIRSSPPEVFEEILRKYDIG